VAAIKEAARNDPTYEQAWKKVDEGNEATAPEKEQRMDRKARSKDMEMQMELLYRKGMLWVPEGLTQEVLKSEYDTKVAGHMGQDKTIELV